MSHPYSRKSSFPYPILPVTIYRAQGEAVTSILTAQMDTGAEVTMVPALFLPLERLDLLHVVRMRSHWGEPRSVKLYQVDLVLENTKLSAVEIIADPYGEEVLLGRNVLNKLILLLDGIREQTDVLTRRPARF